MASLEEEFELNFIKIDSKNDIRLLRTKDYVKEYSTLFKSVSKFENESIDNNITSFLKKNIPESTDLLKLNIDYSKQFLKLINSDKKKGFNSSINHILSTDFKDQFIFNKKNLQDVCNILTFSFNEIKNEGRKYKISNAKDFKSAVENIKFKKYDFYKIFVNNDYLKNKEKTDQTISSGSSRGKSTTYSSFSIQVKDDDNSEEDNNVDLNRYHNEARGIYYVDNNIRNIICSSMLTNDYNYNEEEELKKLLTKECFLYPKNNKSALPDQNELPIELILLLDKLKNVKTLIFQIQTIDDLFLKMAIFVLINIKWLFISRIEEVKYDLGNEDIQRGLIEKYSERAGELYHIYKKIKDLNYYDGSCQARTINCWEPEGDIFFEKVESQKSDNNKKSEYLYNMQPIEEVSTFDNYLSNIYNEFGNLTKLKYIRPFGSIIKRKEFQKLEDFDDMFNMIVDDQKQDKDTLSTTSSCTSKKSSIQSIGQTIPNTSNNNLNNDVNPNKIKIRHLISQLISKYKAYFDMILIYSYFFTTNLKNIKKLSLYFHSPFSYEICLKQKSSIDQSHFLLFMNKVENLSEANFSFNSLDDKSFINILGVIKKNVNLSSLKMSFFTPDINYYCDSLFSLLYSKKIGMTKCFQEQKEYEITNNNQDKVKQMQNYILNEKLLDSFGVNLCNFLNTIKFFSLNNLQELVMRFDIPLPLLDNQKYIILMIKFIINIIIMITFQGNKVHTLKLIAPYLEVNGSNLPYINQFFRELSLKEESDEIEESLNDEDNIKKTKTKIMGMKEKKEKDEKEKEKNEKNETKEKKEKKPFNHKKFISQKSVKLDMIENKTNQPIEETIKEKKEDDNDDNSDDFDNNDNYENKRFNTIMPKNNLQQATKREESLYYEELTNKKRTVLNINSSLEHLTMHFKIYDLPDIFNVCLMNNLSGLKSINIGVFDEITFIGFMNNYKEYSNNLINLTSLKISLGISVTSYIDIEQYILEFININSPNIEEKLLFSDLRIINENKMRDLIQLVYEDALVPKLVIQISNENSNLLSKVLSAFIKEKKEKCSNEMNSMLILMNIPEYKKLYNQTILECLSSFYGMKKNRVIICKEN